MEKKWVVDLCSGEQCIIIATSRTEHCLLTESHAHLDLVGLTTPTTVSTPEALFILTPGAVLESPVAADRLISLSRFAHFYYST